MSWLAQPWQWWTAFGALLLILELLTPGTFFMWLGLAGFAVSAVMFAVPSLSMTWQILLFGALSALAVVLWRRYAPTRTEKPNSLNQVGQAHIGCEYVLVEAITHGVGRAKVADSTWRVTGPDLPVGATVRVMAVEGATLRVQGVPHAPA